MSNTIINHALSTHNEGKYLMEWVLSQANGFIKAVANNRGRYCLADPSSCPRRLMTGTWIGFASNMYLGKSL